MQSQQKYLFPAPTWTEIAKAAREAIRAVKADFPDVEDIHLAALIGADSTTPIKKLEKMETQKVPASLFAGIGRVYGEQYVKTYRDLMMPCRNEEAINALPAITALAAKLAASAREGRDIDHQALGTMLTELRDVDAVVSRLRAKASEWGMTA